MHIYISSIISHHPSNYTSLQNNIHISPLIYITSATENPSAPIKLSPLTATTGKAPDEVEVAIVADEVDEEAVVDTLLLEVLAAVEEALVVEVLNVKLLLLLFVPATLEGVAERADVVALIAEDEFATADDAAAVPDPVAEATRTVVVEIDGEEPEEEVGFAWTTVTLPVATADVDTIELEDEPLLMTNGKEYWKVEVSESRVSLKP